LALFAGADATAQGVRGRRALAAEVSNATCGGGAYSVVNSPDGTAITVLFDNFIVTGAEAGSGIARTSCAVEIPLNLPEGYSLGVFRMDYRGFAHLDEGQIGALSVDYGVGRRGPGLGRNFFRPIRGPKEGDFTFTERLRPGVLRRAGCGEDARLNLTAALDLRAAGGSPEANLTLDSVDGTRGVTFFVDLQPCRERAPRT
jgi:hypothetical protein